ncbi:hypothetical protein [Hymenobacter crusticola]|nr:hypothetical protein [Hymenobacter crusticola]
MTQAETSPDFGEVNIPAHLDALYLLGDTIALFNSVGLLLLPGFSPDVTLNHRTGLWVICDAEHIELQGFTPEKAASQFGDFTGEPLRVVLGGYARKSYQLLEPHYPGFVQGLLAQLWPEPVPVIPQPRPQILDLAQVFQAYGCCLQTDGKHARLTFAPPAVPLSRPPDWQLVFASVTLFVAQLNLTPWLLHVAACDPTHEVAQLLGAVARHELREPEWGGVIPRLFGAYRRREKLFAQLTSQPLPIAVFLSLLMGIYEHPENPEDIYEELPVFKILRVSLEKLPLDDSSALYEFVLACLIDGIEYLAREADAQGSALASLRFAQEAQIALQLLMERAAPPLTERWFSRVEVHEQGYSWSKLNPDQVLDHWTVWYFANYAGSAAFTVKQHSKQIARLFEQGKITNHLWTAVWRVLNQLRKALRLCYALSQQQPSTAAEGSKDLALTLQNLLAHYQQILKEVAAMIARSSSLEHGLSHWATLMTSRKEKEQEEAPLMQELLACMDVHGILESHGYGPEAVQRLGKLIAKMP